MPNGMDIANTNHMLFLEFVLRSNPIYRIPYAQFIETISREGNESF